MTLKKFSVRQKKKKKTLFGQREGGVEKYIQRDTIAIS